MKKIITTLSFALTALLGYPQGFSTTATNWPLPSGGQTDGFGHNYGFNDPANPATYYNNCLGWSIFDINGDGKTDLVVTAHGDGTYADCMGVGVSPHWDVYLNTGSGFSTTATNWVLPSGGQTDGFGHNYGFNDPANNATYYNNCLGWTTLDISGDGKPDLVITSQGDGTYADCMGVGVSPHWDVYLNTGSGFSTTATNWALPPGGQTDYSGHNYGFNDPANPATYYNNSLGWNLLDINADGKPDLVITSLGNGTYGDCMGVGVSPHWDVYLNTGSGFSTTATTWTLPSGGQTDYNGHNYGFNDPANPATYYNNSLAWNILDINADGKPDLVITSQGNGTYADCMGVGVSPHWDVYLNTGSGFSTTATNWVLPSGGQTDYQGHNYGFNDPANNATYYNNCLGWTILDINADGKPDLVITSQGDGTYGDCLGVSSSPHWDAYLNTGSGFSTTANNCAFPSGGQTDLNGHNYGFNDPANPATYYNNCLGWAILDINGDGKSDLVVTSQGNGTYGDCLGVSSSPHWDVYLNTSPSSGIDETENILGTVIYPNPFTENITIKSSGFLFGQSYKIYDNTGRIISSGKLLDETGTINLSNLSQGIYFLQLADQGVRTFKVIKQ